VQFYGINILHRKIMHMKINKIQPVAGLLSVIIGLSSLFSCQKKISNEDGNASTQQLTVFLTDNPAFFEKLMIDIRGIEVCVDTSENSGRRRCDDDDDDDCTWVKLDVRQGFYDLVRLRNGIDTLLASGNLPHGELKKLRVELGPSNSVVISGVSYPLVTLGGNSLRIIVKIDDDLLKMDGQGRIKLHLDIDAGRSVIVSGGNYFLVPYMKTFCEDRMGRIEGRILPEASLPAVITVYNALDTAIALPDPKDGKFKLRGLPDGIYQMSVKASNGYRDTLITGLNVNKDRDLKLSEIRLHK
jgi:hypothetical protein